MIAIEFCVAKPRLPLCVGRVETISQDTRESTSPPSAAEARIHAGENGTAESRALPRTYPKNKVMVRIAANARFMNHLVMGVRVSGFHASRGWYQYGVPSCQYPVPQGLKPATLFAF